MRLHLFCHFWSLCLFLEAFSPSSDKRYAVDDPQNASPMIEPLIVKEAEDAKSDRLIFFDDRQRHQTLNTGFEALELEHPPESIPLVEKVQYLLGAMKLMQFFEQANAEFVAELMEKMLMMSISRHS